MCILLNVTAKLYLECCHLSSLAVCVALLGPLSYQHALRVYALPINRIVFSLVPFSIISYWDIGASFMTLDYHFCSYHKQLTAVHYLSGATLPFRSAIQSIFASVNASHSDCSISQEPQFALSLNMEGIKCRSSKENCETFLESQRSSLVIRGHKL